MHIVFLTKSVSILGGKEKVLLDLAEDLVNSGNRVEVASYDGIVRPFKTLHPSINCTSLYLEYFDLGFGFFKRIKFLPSNLRTINKFINDRKDSQFITTDHLISILSLFSSKALKGKLIVWEHVSYTTLQSRFWTYLRDITYRKVKKVVALNPVEARYFELKGSSVACISNSICPNYIRNISKSNCKTVVWVGAVVKEKGIEDLVLCARIIKERKRHITINVFGKGDMVDWLGEQIITHNLQEVIHYKGISDNMEAVYTAAALALVTSYHESFSMIILEASSYGVPTIAYDCPTGPGTLINHSTNGYLVPLRNYEEMAELTVDLLNDTEKLNMMSSAAFASSFKYDKKTSLRKWEKILT